MCLPRCLIGARPVRLRMNAAKFVEEAKWHFAKSAYRKAICVLKLIPCFPGDDCTGAFDNRTGKWYHFSVRWGLCGKSAVASPSAQIFDNGGL